MLAGLSCLALAGCLESQGGADGVGKQKKDGGRSGPGPGEDQVDLAGETPGLDGGTQDLRVTASADLAGMADAGPGPGPGTEPFDPASCPDPALSQATALTMLAGSPRKKLGDATLMVRTRTCTGATVETCGAWSVPAIHIQRLLTYSGGVTTAYKAFSFPTHLMLFAQAGVPKVVVRHESDVRKNPTADTRGVVFAVGSSPSINTYPVINVWDFAPEPNRYDDLSGLLGNRGLLHAAEHCARVVFPTGLTQEVAALYRY